MKKIDWSRPILIGGPPSTGTTLMSVMLDAHPDVFCGPELSVFSNPAIFSDFSFFKEKLKHYYLSDDFKEDPLLNLKNGFCPYVLLDEGNLTFYGFNTALFLELLNASKNFGTFARKFFRPSLEKTNKKIWAEKSPSNLYAFGAFLDYYPQGRVICLVRDARDQICSLLRRKFSFKRTLSIWLIETAICELYRTHPRVFFVRYEDLVCNTRQTLQDLLNFLELTPEIDCVLNYFQTSSRANMDPTITALPTWHSNPSQPISTQPVGQWRGMLTAEQLLALSAAFITYSPVGYPHLAGQTVSELLKQLDYEPVVAQGFSKTELLELLINEKLFLSGDDYINPQIFRERFVECDLERLPELGFSWKEERFQAKLANLRVEQVKTRTELANLRVEQTNTQSQLTDTQAELAHLRVEQTNTQSQLTDTQAELAHLQVEHTNTQSQLANTQAELTSLQVEQGNAQAELKVIRTELETLRTEWIAMRVERATEQAAIQAERTDRAAERVIMNAERKKWFLLVTITTLGAIVTTAVVSAIAIFIALNGLGMG